jgi:hypothetical protein
MPQLIKRVGISPVHGLVKIPDVDIAKSLTIGVDIKAHPVLIIDFDLVSMMGVARDLFEVRTGCEPLS